MGVERLEGLCFPVESHTRTNTLLAVGPATHLGGGVVYVVVRF